LVVQGIFSRFRATMHDTNQQKRLGVLGARASSMDSRMECLIRNACQVGLPVILFV
jgi:hypothetical protein